MINYLPYRIHEIKRKLGYFKKYCHSYVWHKKKENIIFYWQYIVKAKHEYTINSFIKFYVVHVLIKKIQIMYENKLMKDISIFNVLYLILF